MKFKNLKFIFAQEVKFKDKILNIRCLFNKFKLAFDSALIYNKIQVEFKQIHFSDFCLLMKVGDAHLVFAKSILFKAF